MPLRQRFLALSAFIGLGVLPRLLDSLGYLGAARDGIVLALGLAVALQTGLCSTSVLAAAVQAFGLVGVGLAMMLGTSVTLLRLQSAECYYCPPLSDAIGWMLAVTLVAATLAGLLAALTRLAAQITRNRGKGAV
jgi:hypothetical protein